MIKTVVYLQVSPSLSLPVFPSPSPLNAGDEGYSKLFTALYILVFLYDRWTRGFNRERTGRPHANPTPYPCVVRTRFARFFFRARKLQRGCEQSKATPPIYTTASRDQSKPIRIGENLVVIYHHIEIESEYSSNNDFQSIFSVILNFTLYQNRADWIYFETLEKQENVFIISTTSTEPIWVAKPNTLR